MDKCQDFAMDSFLEELEVFRWRLYIAKDESAEERASLFEEACSKQISELFIEECLIAYCDINTVEKFNLRLFLSFVQKSVTKFYRINFKF